MRYRPDIDGLRALAVIPVVFFHAGIKPFSGGFTGVDVFFVISGYLITSLIDEEIRQGTFSIVQFYERRVRRIFPALFAVIIFCSVFAWRLMLPRQFDDFSKSVFSTALFVSNILFAREEGYFAAPAIEKPLLHTWSLAVEEQFYIIFPLLLFIIHRWLKGRWITSLVPLAVASFALSVWGVGHKPEITFYLAPTRAWELLLGALLAVGAIPQVENRAWRELMGILGLGLIAWGIFALTGQSPFPGLNALFPAGGSALVIHSATNSETSTSRVLATRPLVLIGLISYSLYLWHWPLLVCAQFMEVDSLTLWQTSSVIAVSFLIAIISWRFVELPFRRRAGILRQKPLLAGSAFLMSCFATFGLLGHFSHGWPYRIPREALQLATVSWPNPRQKECIDSPSNPISPSDACVYGASVTPIYALWGDSHADALIETIGNVAARHGQSVKFLGNDGCPPIVGVRVVPPTNDCFAYNEAAIDYLTRTSALQVVIIASRWTEYVEGSNHDFGPAERNRADLLLSNATGSVTNLGARKDLFSLQIHTTVQRLIHAGKIVVLVYPIPETGYNIPVTLAQIRLNGGDPSQFTRPESYYLHRQKFVFSALDKLGSTSRIIRIYPNVRLCDGTNCIVYARDKALYYDDNHLSLAGADYISDLFDSLFKPTMAETVDSWSK